jgi:hypothetical protein
MKEDVNINGNKTDEKTKSQRDAMGRFVKGSPGGPGRGKKADELDLTNLNEDEFWSVIEDFNRQDLASSDAMIRQRAMKFKVMKDDYLLRKKAESKVEEIFSPENMAIVSILQALKRQNMDIFEVKEKVLKFCSKCEKIGPVRKFNLPGDTEEPEGGGGPDLMGPIDP